MNSFGSAGRFVHRVARLAGVIVCCLLLGLAGCATQNPKPSQAPPPAPTQPPSTPPPQPQAIGVEPLPEASNASPLAGPEIYPGRSAPPAAPRPPPPIGIAEGGTVTLNFVNAGIREFIDSVLGNTLVTN